MDQPAVDAETFVLRAYIDSRAVEHSLKKLLEDIQGVRQISIDTREIGRFTISGTIDPETAIQILRNNGVYSKRVFEPRINLRDLPNVPAGPKSSPAENHATIDKETVERLEKLSKLTGFKSVELTKDGVKLKYKKEKNVQHLDDKNGSCSENMDSMNGGGVQYGTNRGYTAIGIPLQTAPGDFPSASAPPMSAENYPDSHSEETYSDDHDSTAQYSDDNPAGLFVFFFLFIFVLFFHAALS